MTWVNKFFLLGLLIPNFVSGQSTPVPLINDCGPGGESNAETITLVNSGSTVKLWPVKCEKRRKMFKDLIEAAGLPNTKLRLMEVNQKSLATYLKADATKAKPEQTEYIVYNYDDFKYDDSKDSNDIVFAGTIAHELGHYLNHHEDSRQDKEQELDADYFLGFLLQQLNYTLPQVKACLQNLKESGDSVHPPNEERARIIKNGYENAARKVSATAFANANPRVLWSTATCDVTEAGVVISKDRPDRKCPWTSYREIGVYYSDVTNSTYQLNLNVPIRAGAYTGLGRLVNNRTSFTYIKSSDNGYQIYNRGKLVLRAECDNPYAPDSKLGFDSTKVDFLVHCNDGQGTQKKYILLKDYGLTGQGQVMPAILVTNPSDLGR